MMNVKITSNTSTDLAIRLLHLIILLSFIGAYITGDAEEWHQIHMAFGYTLAIGLLLRILWQFFAVRLAKTQPIGLGRRMGMVTLFFKRDWKNPQIWYTSTFLKATASSIFQLSILGLFISLPLTVILGYFTQTLHSHTLKEIHEFFANLFLAFVFVHLAALALNSFMLKQWLAKRMFWGKESTNLSTWSYVLFILVAVAYFWWWFFV